MVISVIGMTVAGLVYAATLANAGYKVLASDMDEELINAIKEGELPGYEKGLKEAVQEAVNKENLEFTGNTRRVIKDASVFFIACETPEDEEGRPSGRFAKAILATIANHMEDEKTVILTGSYVPGTSEALFKEMQDVLDEREENLSVKTAVVPNMWTPGKMLKEAVSPKSVVIGCEDEITAEQLKAIFRKLRIPESKLEVVSLLEAEMTSLGAAGMQAVKKAFINEFAQLCNAWGADSDKLMKIINRLTKTGGNSLLADAGFGGSVLPKKIRTMKASKKDKMLKMPVLDAVLESNAQHLTDSVEQIEKALGDLTDRKIAVLGIAPEAGSDDLREAPSLFFIEQLAKKGARLQLYSPEGYAQARWRLFKVKENVTFCQNIYEAAKEADAVITLSKLQGTRSVNKKKVREQMAGNMIFDFASIFIKNSETQTLFDYCRTGRKEEEKYES